METIKAHPDALAKALEIAKGDRSKLDIQKDGSVIVRNYSVRQRGKATERR